MAGKDNTIESDIDKSSFFWTGQCGACHPGGGPGEQDRDGETYFDAVTGEFGYEKLGMTSADVTLDGDYAFVNPGSGMLMPAPWDVTGVSEPDCLLCHRTDRTVANNMDKNAGWRQMTLRSMAGLVDSTGTSVPAYAAAPTAAQGWYSSLVAASLPGKPPTAAELQIDYGVGIQDGSLLAAAGNLLLTGDQISKTPKDFACWGCHAIPDLKKRGRTWFDPKEDVHYAGFNNLTDADLTNDVAATSSTACSSCHPSGSDHNFAKGNAFVGSVMNSTDYKDLRTCSSCHLDGPNKDPAAPLPSQGTIHDAHGNAVSCQLCHIAYKSSPADLVVDNATTGATIGYKTSAFLSADPLDPTSTDKSMWFPAIKWKTDEDGVERLFPAKILNTVWWGDWNQNGTPADLSDDVIEPLILWRVRQATGGAPLAGVTDDNGDGKLEVNTAAEILLYIDTFENFFDSYGTPIAEVPVLIKGGLVWYEDPNNPGTLATFELHDSGILAESSVPFSIDHNVLPADQAFGNCAQCHFQAPSVMWDRSVLLDPFGLDGQPVYDTPRQMTGMP